MPNSLVQFVFAVLALVAGASAEELLPKFAGVGFPVLLAAVQFFAVRSAPMTSVLFALAAGGAEDALSSLPFFLSASYFLGVSEFVRRTGLPPAAGAVAYPLYQLWLAVWMQAPEGGFFVRVLLSVPIGLATVWGVRAFLGFIERKAAVGELD